MLRSLKKVAFIATLLVIAQSHQAGATYVKGSWITSVYTGIAPTYFNKVGTYASTVGLNGRSLPANPIVYQDNDNANQASKKFQFPDLYYMPFILGADMGKFIYDNFEVFVNLTYMHARGKKFFVRRIIEESNVDPKNKVAAFWRPGNINSLALYTGARKYFEWASSIYPFIGGKLGLILAGTAKRGIQSFEIQGNVPFVVAPRIAESCSALFAGGIQLGFDWRASATTALTFMAELHGATGRIFKTGRQFHSNQSLANTNMNGSSNLAIFSNVARNPKGRISCPVTAGIRVSL